MATESEVQKMASELVGSGKTFAEFLAELFKDRFIEIYLGDSYEEVSMEQTSTSYPAVLCGKVVTAYRECLVINAAYVSGVPKPGKPQQLQLGNLLFVNERSIRALTEIDGKGILEDMLLRSRHSLDIKKHFIK
jgi:hypothetical protein